MNLKEIKLQPELEKAVLDLGFSEFTEVQEKAIPIIQAGKDVIAQSFTGSGKTAAFGFPMLEKINSGQGLQGLVLVPTRELCNQVSKELFKFAKYKKTHIVEVYGGVSINPQMDLLRRADLVVATPGRLLDHLERGTINLSKIKILVLDEADRMFDMGFIDDVKRIIGTLPKDRQTLLFSATISREVHELVRNYMKNPEKVKLQSYLDKSKIIQHYYNIESRDKFSLMVHLFKSQGKGGLILVFCATRHMVDQVSRNLQKQGIQSMPLHGGLTQARRKQVMDMFHAHKLDVLVASDVAARGLDIKGVTYVVNYDIPKSSQDYVHRIGRTARAGAEGKVVSLLAPQDHDNFRRVLEDRSLFVEKLQNPEFERIAFAKGETQQRYGGGNRFSGGNRGGGSGGFRPRFGGHNTRFGGHSESRYGGGRSEDRRGGFGRNNNRRDHGSGFRDV